MLREYDDNSSCNSVVHEQVQNSVGHETTITDNKIVGKFYEVRGVDFPVSRKAQRRNNLDSLKENIFYFIFPLKTEYLL